MDPTPLPSAAPGRGGGAHPAARAAATKRARRRRPGAGRGRSAAAIGAVYGALTRYIPEAHLGAFAVNERPLTYVRGSDPFS